MSKTKPKRSAPSNNPPPAGLPAAVGPTGQAQTDPAAPIVCPTCKADQPQLLRTDRRAGFTFYRYCCHACRRVFIERDPPFPRRKP